VVGLEGRLCQLRTRVLRCRQCLQTQPTPLTNTAKARTTPCKDSSQALLYCPAPYHKDLRNSWRLRSRTIAVGAFLLDTMEEKSVRQASTGREVLENVGETSQSPNDNARNDDQEPHTSAREPAKNTLRPVDVAKEGITVISNPQDAQIE
jgi:hypothetical protein